MADVEAPEPGPARARRLPRDDARPQSLPERQQSIGAYLVRRSQRRRERFLRRSRTMTIGSELLRAGYLAGCILLDFLVVPEPIFLFPGAAGWVLAAVAFVLAVGVEGWYYSRTFALPKEDEGDET